MSGNLRSSRQSVGSATLCYALAVTVLTRVLPRLRDDVKRRRRVEFEVLVDERGA